MKVLQKNGEMAEMSFEEQEGRKAFWHTSAHVLAQAVKHLYPDTKCAICLLYTSDAADDLLCVDLGGCRINKKKKTRRHRKI